MSENNSPDHSAAQAPPRLPTNFAQSARGARKLAPWAAGILISGVIITYLFSGGRHVDHPRSTALTLPQMPVPAGGENNSAVMDKTNRDADKAAAEKARRNHSSYASALQGSSAPSQSGGELGDTPMQEATKSTVGNQSSPSMKPQGEVTTAQPDKPAPVSAPSPQPPVKPLGFANSDASSPRPPRPGTLSDAQKAELFALWGGRPASLDVNLPAGGYTAAGKTSASEASGFDAPQRPDMEKSVSTEASGPISNGANKHNVLLRGGRGIIAHAVVTVNSDIGSDVLLEADSGPFVRARMTGTFTMQSDLLVIKINKLMIGDDPPVAVNAFVVAPGSGEAGVATEVNEHLMTRVALPAAAAFVQGLGTALQNNNTQTYTAGLGLTSFTHYTLPQQLGMAAGAVGQSLGQFLQKQTPQKATAKLEQGASVGVIFLEPVYAP